MYQHLSETAKQVLKLAEDVAKREHMDYVGSEHVLLAMIEHGVGMAVQVLQNCSITSHALTEQMRQLSKKSSEETWVFGRLPGTPHFKQVIAYAIEEAEKNRDKKVGTEYILLGLLREKGCVAETALRQLGLSLEKARQEISLLQGRPV